MSAFRASCLMFAMLVLCGFSCGGGEGSVGGQNMPLGGSLKPATPSSSEPRTRETEQLAQAAQELGGAPASVSDPGRRIFDGSLATGQLEDAAGVGDGAVAAYGAGRGGQLARTNAPARRNTLRIGDVPTPEQLALARAEVAEGSKGGGGPALRAYRAFQEKVYGAAESFAVFSRSDWKAGAHQGAQSAHKPDRVTVHHTDGAKQTDELKARIQVQKYQALHWGYEMDRYIKNGRVVAWDDFLLENMRPEILVRDPKREKWADVGYHILMDGLGRLYEGRPMDIVGSHAKGANSNNVGISVMGNYNRDYLGEPQKESLERLISFVAIRYKGDLMDADFIRPHKHYTGTSCPGSHVIAFLGELRQRVAGEAKRVASAVGSDEFSPLAVVRTRGQG